MRRIIYAIASMVAILLSTSCHVGAQGWQLVMMDSAPISGLTQEEVKLLYLDRKLNNPLLSRLEVADWQDVVLRDGFHQQVLGYSPIRWRIYWSKLVYTGQAEPPVQLNEQRWLTWLRGSNHRMLYLPVDQTIPNGVKVVYRWLDSSSYD